MLSDDHPDPNTLIDSASIQEHINNMQILGQELHSSVCLQKIGHFSAPVSIGEADADNTNDGKEKCIVCKGDICDTNNMASE